MQALLLALIVYRGGEQLFDWSWIKPAANDADHRKVDWDLRFRVYRACGARLTGLLAVFTLLTRWVILISGTPFGLRCYMSV